MAVTKQTLEIKYIISFIFYFLIIITIGFSLFGLIIGIFLNRNIGPTYLEGVFTLSQLQAHLPLILFITAFVQTLVLGIIILVLVLLWSHSVAGPLVRFKRRLREIAQGKLSPESVVFRVTDQLHSLAQAFSELINAHAQKDKKSLALLVEAQKLLDKCQLLSGQEKFDSDEFKSNLKNLQQVYLQIKDVYSGREFSR